MERAAGGTHDARLQPSDTTEPAGLGSVQGGSVVPFFTGHSVLAHGMASRGATAETSKLSGAGLRLHPCRRGKQGSDCYTPSLTAYIVQYKERGSDARATEALSRLDKDA